MDQQLNRQGSALASIRRRASASQTECTPSPTSDHVSASIMEEERFASHTVATFGFYAGRRVVIGRPAADFSSNTV